MNRRASILAACLVVLAGSAARNVRAQGFTGCASLFSSHRLTVVWPSAGDEPDVARRSAERRVAHLRAFYGVDAVAVADDRVEDSDLAGAVLLLGWENRLLEAILEAGLLRRSGDGWVFLDDIPIGAEEHLMFDAPSPFSERGWLYFWSRIDPELDRFQVIPFLGSDWAIYDGYLARRQGQYSGSRKWPPTRDPGAENDRGEQPELRQVRRRGGSYRLHAPEGVLSPEQEREVLRSRQEALAVATRSFGDPGPDFVIDLFVFTDADQKLDWTDVPDPSHSVPRRTELYMVRDLALTPNPHEEIHLLARRLWGATVSTALYEGVALRFEAPERLPALAALLVDQQAMPTIDALLDEERLRAQMRSGLGIGPAALLVDWLDSIDDDRALRRLYVARPVDPEALASITGRSPDELQAGFEKHVRALATRGNAEYRFERAFAEARKLRADGRTGPAIERLTEALDVRPEDAGALYLMGLLCIDSEDPARAEPWLLRLAALGTDDPDSRFVAYAPYLLGRMFERLGRVEEARAAYRGILETPDRHESHRRAREALANLGEKSGSPGRSGD